MDYSYNDVLRRNICKENIEDSIMYFESLPYENKETMLDLMLLDYYKLEYMCNKNYPDLFELSKEEIYKKCIYDTEILVDLLEATYAFNNISFCNKCIIMDQMHYYNQDRSLIKISKLHLLDKFTYIIKDDLDSYKEYYIDFKNKTKIDLLDSFVYLLSLRFYKTKDIDINKYKKNILEILKVYYKWKNFIKSHDGEYLLNPEDKNYIKNIEEKELDMLLELIDNDECFFTYILGEYLHYTTSNLEIKEEVVDNYLSITASKKLKKKFDIK